jgi:hypothetical protein
VARDQRWPVPALQQPIRKVVDEALAAAPDLRPVARAEQGNMEGGDQRNRMSAVSIVADAVLGFARLRRRARRLQATESPIDRRLRVLRRHVPGRSFVDVGGMYGMEGEIAFQAEEAGASSVTLFDASEPPPGFLERHGRSGSSIRCVQGDLEDPGSLEEIGPHDIVWCTGVIYHTPHPLRQLMQLREITRDLLFLGSATIPEVPGFPQACVYYPFLSREDRTPYARGVIDPDRAIGVGTSFDERPMYGHGNFWWGITPSALRAMLRTARFEVIEEFPHEAMYPWGLDLLARPIPLAPSLPPVDYYRERGARLAEGRPPPFDGYYEKGADAVAADSDLYPDLDGLPTPDIRAPRRWLRRRPR